METHGPRQRICNVFLSALQKSDALTHRGAMEPEALGKEPSSQLWTKACSTGRGWTLISQWPCQTEEGCLHEADPYGTVCRRKVWDNPDASSWSECTLVQPHSLAHMAKSDSGDTSRNYHRRPPG